MAPAPTPAKADADVIAERGGWISRLRHRTELRGYSSRIHAREITYDELRDYLEKGGNPTVLTLHTPILSDTKAPLLNYFIEGEHPFQALHPFPPGADGTPSSEPWSPAPYSTDRRPDRIRSLKLLLDNGASPDVVLDVPASNFTDASPLLWASWLGDVDAMRLLIDYGADVDQVQENIHFSSGPFGPPLLLAQSDAAADLLFGHGADPHLRIVRDHEEHDIVQELVFSENYSYMEPYILLKLKWFQRNGIRFEWEGRDPVAAAYAQKRFHESGGYASDNPFLIPAPERARLWGEIADALEAIRQPRP